MVEIFFSTFFFSRSRSWVDDDLVAAVCGESYQCKFDFVTTLSREFAAFTKFYQDEYINIREGVLKPEARGTTTQNYSLRVCCPILTFIDSPSSLKFRIALNVQLYFMAGS